MDGAREAERYEAIVIGGGQAGLSVGYYLKNRGVRFVILDASPRVGDSWRNRWDSLRLFTPARFDGIPGMRFPASAHVFPSKDEMADYLESYAARLALPVRSGVRVERLARRGDGYVVDARDARFEADHVIVAMSNYQRPKVPECARGLDPGIIQVHSSEYRNPAQLRDGGVLVCGAGNSGAEIAVELARAGRPTWLAGRDVGQIPFRIEGHASRLFLARLVLRFVFHRVLTVSTPIGRRVRPAAISQGGPRIRVKRADLDAAGVERVGRVTGVRDGQPVLDDGRVLGVENVIWSTGYDPGFSWIALPVLGSGGEPRQRRGVVTGEPGLYFVGLHFLYAMSSVMIHGVGRDAEHVARVVVGRLRANRRAQAPRVPESDRDALNATSPS